MILHILGIRCTGEAFTMSPGVRIKKGVLFLLSVWFSCDSSTHTEIMFQVFPVHYLGWMEVRDADVMSGRSGAVVSDCIQQLHQRRETERPRVRRKQTQTQTVQSHLISLINSWVSLALIFRHKWCCWCYRTSLSHSSTRLTTPSCTLSQSAASTYGEWGGATAG